MLLIIADQGYIKEVFFPSQSAECARHICLKIIPLQTKLFHSCFLQVILCMNIYCLLKYGTIKCYKYLNENIHSFRTVYQSLSTLLKLETQVQGDRTFGREKLGYLWQSYLCLKFAMANEDIE